MNPSFGKHADVSGKGSDCKRFFLKETERFKWVRRDRRNLWASLMVLWALAGIGNAAAGQTEAPAILDAHSLIDQTGRRIHFIRPFSRIISLYGAHTENLFALGLKTEIIGVSPNEDYPPEALQKKVFTYHDDAEKFLAAAPDLVLARPMIERGYPGLISRLEQSGITVVSLQPATVAEMFVYWRIIGRLTGKQAEAEKMIDTFTRAIDSLRSLGAGVENKKRVYLEAIHDKMKTFTPDAMAASVLQAAGGINAAADAEQVRTTNIAAYGKERILAKARSIDVYLAQRGAMNHPSVALIQDEPGFQVIKAVQDNQIYIVDEMIISRPTLRLLAGVYAMGKILYPDRFAAPGRQILMKAGVAVKEAEH
jgi:iron complex transport system substrate-binding protein